MWRPVYKACSLLRKEWNIRESLVKAFATFLVLSYVKTLNITFDLLTFNGFYYDITGKKANVSYLFSNGSMPLFSREHVPYAVCAILMATLFNFLPFILLCVYPCPAFQKCLNLTGCRSQLLHVFMDTFQGCFREKPWDCRYFAGFYIFIRIANLVFLSVFDDPVYLWFVILIFVLAVALIAIFRPYKERRRNGIDIALFSWSILLFTAVSALLGIAYIVPISVNLVYQKTDKLFGFLAFLLPFYGLFLMLHQVVKFAYKVARCHQLKLFSLLVSREKEPLLDYHGREQE